MLIEQIEKRELEKIGAEIPDFRAGDTVRVRVRIVEGATERVQAFEGICIARRNSGIGSSFTVRKISYGEGVERIFPLYSPMIEGIDLIRRGKVRRAKLYYLRALRGKAARITEKRTISSKKTAPNKANLKKAAPAEAPEATSKT